MLTFKRKMVGGGILHRQILIWRNVLYPEGTIGCWHIWVHNRQIIFKDLADAVMRIDKYWRSKQVKPKKY